MSSVGTLSVGLLGDMSGLSRSLDQAAKSVSDFGKKTEEVGKKVTGVGTSMTKWITGPLVGAGAAIAALTVNVGNFADKLLDLEQQTGLTTDALQEWRYVSQIAGVETDAVANTVMGLVRRLPQIAQEAGPGADAIQRLGLNFSELEQMAPDQMIDAVIGSLAGMEDPLQRNATGSQLFGGAWKELAPILGLGADEIDRLRDEAHDLGVVIGRDGLNQANAFRMGWASVKAQMTAVKNEIGIAFAPLMENLLIPLLRDRVIPFVQRLAERIKELIEWFRDLDPRVQRTIGVLLGVAVAIGPVIAIVGKLITAVGALSGALAFLAANPVVAIIGALALIGTAFYTLWNTSESFRDFWITTWERIRDFAVAAINFIIDGINGMITMINAIPFFNIPTLGRIEVGLAPDATAAFDNLTKDTVSAIDNGFREVGSSLSTGLRGVSDKIEAIDLDFASAMEPISEAISSSIRGLETGIERIMQGGGDAVIAEIRELRKNIEKAKEAADEAQRALVRAEGELQSLREGMDIAHEDAQRFRDVLAAAEAHTDSIRSAMEEIQSDGIVLTEEERQAWADRLAAAMREENLARQNLARIGGLEGILEELRIPIGQVEPTLERLRRELQIVQGQIEENTGQVIEYGTPLFELYAQSAMLQRQIAELEAADITRQELVEIAGATEEEIRAARESVDARREEAKEAEAVLADFMKDLKREALKIDVSLKDGLARVAGNIADGVTDISLDLGKVQVAFSDGVLDLKAEIFGMSVSLQSALQVLNVLMSTQTAAILTAVGTVISTLLVIAAPVIAIGILIVGIIKIIQAIGQLFSRIFGRRGETPEIVLPEYSSGGIVSGALGQPQLAIVHGGEPIGAKGFEEAMDYTRFAEAVAAGVYDAMNDILPGEIGRAHV